MITTVRTDDRPGRHIPTLEPVGPLALVGSDESPSARPTRPTWSAGQDGSPYILVSMRLRAATATDGKINCGIACQEGTRWEEVEASTDRKKLTVLVGQSEGDFALCMAHSFIGSGQAREPVEKFMVADGETAASRLTCWRR